MSTTGFVLFFFSFFDVASGMDRLLGLPINE